MEERSLDDVVAYRWVDGESIPIYELTPEMEAEFYAAGEIGPEGLTMYHSKPRSPSRSSES